MVYTIETVKEAMKLYGLSPDDKIDEEALKQKKRDLIKQYHPDRFPDPEEKKKAEEKAKDINSSYDILVWWAKEGQAEYKRAKQYNYGNPYSQSRSQSSRTYQSGNYRRDYSDADFDEILREILAAFFGSSGDRSTSRDYSNPNQKYYRDTYDKGEDYRETPRRSRSSGFWAKLIDIGLTVLLFILLLKWCS